MKKILLTALALCALCGCTKEPSMVNIDEIMEEVLAEMDFYGADEDLLVADDDSLLSDETQVTDGDILTGDADDLLTDE